MMRVGEARESRWNSAFFRDFPGETRFSAGLIIVGCNEATRKSPQKTTLYETYKNLLAAQHAAQRHFPGTIGGGSPCGVVCVVSAM
jgi:hypothetical protein